MKRAHRDGNLGHYYYVSQGVSQQTRLSIRRFLRTKSDITGSLLRTVSNMDVYTEAEFTKIYLLLGQVHEIMRE